MMWSVWDSSSYGWKDDVEKVRVQSLRKLVEVLEFVKEREKKDDLVEFLKYISLPWGYPVDPDAVAEEFNMSRRTAQDYLVAIRAIAMLLLEGYEKRPDQEVGDEEWEEEEEEMIP